MVQTRNTLTGVREPQGCQRPHATESPTRKGGEVASGLSDMQPLAEQAAHSQS